MKILRAYKTELDPNNHQRTSLLRCAGAARFAYNWGLRRKIDTYEAGEKSPTAIDLHRELNKLKKVPKEQGGFPWMYESSKAAPQEALRNLDKAFDAFFRRCKTGKGKPGFPRFKSRKRGIGSFSLTGSIRVFDNAIQLPRLGKLRLKECGYLPESGVKILKATVSEKAGRWFVSLQVEQEIPDPITKDGEILGVDVGVKSLAVLSDGTVFGNPKATYTAERRLRMLQKRVSRRQKGGQNRRKAARAVARQHYRVSCIRKDALHKATSAIANRASIVGIESLNVAGMVKNRCLARAVSDAAIGEFHRQLRYKMAWSGGVVVEADRWFPSSKMCSTCGYILEALPLSVREWVCPKCGAVHDRDQNAGKNLENMAVSSTVTAYRQESSGRDLGSGETISWVGTEHRIQHV